MLIVLLIICIVGLIIVFCIYGATDSDAAGIVGVLVTGAAVGVFIAMIIGLCTLGTVAVKKERLEIYQQENTKIELNIAQAITVYLEHEKDIFIELSAEDIEIYLVAYPELQSNELVKYQLQVIRSNTAEIKQLRDSLLKVKVWKFILYFGK